MKQVFKEIVAHLTLENGLSLFELAHNSLVVIFSSLIYDWFVAWVSLILLQLFLCQPLAFNQMTLSYIPFSLDGVGVLCKGIIKI